MLSREKYDGPKMIKTIRSKIDFDQDEPKSKPGMISGTTELE